MFDVVSLGPNSPVNATKPSHFLPKLDKVKLTGETDRYDKSGFSRALGLLLGPLSIKFR